MANDQDELLDPRITDLENKLRVVTRALQLAFRRDGLAEAIPRPEVATIALAALQAVMPPKDLEGWISISTLRPRENADKQALDLVLYFLTLAPTTRVELAEHHLTDAGVVDIKQRDAVLKQLAKLSAIHAAIAHVLLRAQTPTMAVDDAQQNLFERIVLLAE